MKFANKFPKLKPSFRFRMRGKPYFTHTLYMNKTALYRNFRTNFPDGLK